MLLLKNFATQVSAALSATRAGATLLAFLLMVPTCALASDLSTSNVVPVAIAEVIAKAQKEIFCPDDQADCEQPQCVVTDPQSFTVGGRVQAASGLFASSYGNYGFSLTDGTGGIFVMTDENLHLKYGEWLRVSGTTSCLYGTLVLDNTVVTKAPYKGPVIFAPRQIGQLAKQPPIFGNPEVVENWCDCLMPFSALEGEVITVRGTAVADLEDDSIYGFKLFLDDGAGVAQVFIDADADIPVERIRNTLLVEGADLCVTGVVSEFAGVGYELLPRTRKDIRRARAGRKNPCEGHPADHPQD
ncbi:MAG: hypothetical protein ACO3Z6_15780 [Pseudomonadales bacterium]